MAGGNARWYATLKNSSLVSYKMGLPYNPAVVLLGIFLMKLLFTEQLYLIVHSSSVHNSSNWKQAKYPLIGK